MKHLYFPISLIYLKTHKIKSLRENHIKRFS